MGEAMGTDDYSARGVKHLYAPHCLSFEKHLVSLHFVSPHSSIVVEFNHAVI